MRHEKSALLIELARELAASHMGLTLDEMAQRIGVKRRTVERMRDRLLEMFDTMEEVKDPPHKRWRIAGKLDGFLQAPNAKELAALKTAMDHFESHNSDAANALKGLENKMLTAIGPKLSRLAPDIEALMQAEAIAVSQGPKPIFDPFVLNIIRDAILQLSLLSFNYSGGSKTAKIRNVIPYGIIFGGEAYLIAHEANESHEIIKSERPKMWRIDRISSPKLIDGQGGAPEDFSLKEFAERSFGVFQEDIIHDVKLKVFADHAEEALRRVFHPKQKIEELKNGDLLISMKGAGLKELAWSLFRWGGKIEIISPQELKDELKEALKLGKGLIGKMK